jgi:hypothetical protein
MTPAPSLNLFVFLTVWPFVTLGMLRLIAPDYLHG